MAAFSMASPSANPFNPFPKSVDRSVLGMMLSCPEEIAYRMGFIDRDTLRLLGTTMRNNQYGAFLLQL